MAGELWHCWCTSPDRGTSFTTHSFTLCAVTRVKPTVGCLSFKFLQTEVVHEMIHDLESWDPWNLRKFPCVFQDPNELQLLERWPGAYSWKLNRVNAIWKSRCGYQGLRLHYTDNHRTGVDRFSTRFWSGSPALSYGGWRRGVANQHPRFNDV